MVKHLDQCSFAAAVETLIGEFRPIVTRATPTPAKPETDEEYEREQHHKAAWLWQHRQPIGGMIAEIYLRSRGITCPLPATLGYLAPTKPGHHPALISAFDFAGEVGPGMLATRSKVDTVHLTLLRPDGSAKADVDPNKIMIGRSLGLPIVIAPVDDLLGLAVTEGIEDGLSVFQATGLGVWVAGSGRRMPALAPSIPNYVEAITIYAHGDDKTGRDGALGLAEALWPRGIEIIVEASNESPARYQ
jgi:hypothetical protein